MQQEQDIKSKVITGLFWKLMERGGTQGIQFIVQIFLARLLVPQDYGIVALITVFIALANVFIQTGFNTALIQKKNADAMDYSSVLFLSLFVAGLLYIILFFAAPSIASFYKEEQLILVLRVLSLTLFPGAINSIQVAIVSRSMQFKRLFFSSIGSIIFSGAVGIIMAYKGCGVWALVGQQLTGQIAITLILWFTVKWRPKKMLSFKRLQGLFSYGWKVLCSALLNTVYNNVYNLVIGRIYNPVTLGYFNRGDQFPNLIVTNINDSIQSVMFPALSANQDNRESIKSMVRRSIMTSSLIIFPAMIGLAVCAEPLVKIVLTDKWLPCVPFLQLSCITYALWPIHTANLQAINALGRSDIYLKLEIIKKGIGIASLCISIPFGIYVMVAFRAITGIIASFINIFPNKRLLAYGYMEQWKDIMPSLILSLIMGSAIYLIKFLGLAAGITLVMQILIGAVLYVGMAIVCKLECFSYLLDNLKRIINRKTK